MCFGRRRRHQPLAANVERREVPTARAMTPPTNLRLEVGNVELREVSPSRLDAADVERRENRTASAITPPAGIRSHQTASHIMSGSRGRTIGTNAQPSEGKRAKPVETTTSNPILNSVNNESATRNASGLRGWFRKVKAK
jgi:hypothetical protein